MQPVVLAPGEGETITQRQERSLAITRAHDLVDVTESRYAPGERDPAPHVHGEHADAFSVLEGELVFTLGADRGRHVSASAGTLVLVPAGVVRSFGNDGPDDARFLDVQAPSRGFAGPLRVLEGALTGRLAASTHGKVVAGSCKDGGSTVELVDEAARGGALTLPGAELCDPGMRRTMREWVHVRLCSRPTGSASSSEALASCDASGTRPRGVSRSP